MESQKKKQRYEKEIERAVLYKEVFRLHSLENQKWEEISKKTGYSRGQIFKIIRTFKTDNPEIADQMKKQGKDLVPEDYKILQDEIIKLKAEVKKESLRADFYQEMVAFGKKVYGIDLKKAGTK